MRNMAVLALVICALISPLMRANWVDDYVGQIDEEFGEIDNRKSTDEFAPRFLLPLSSENWWRYTFTDLFSGSPPTQQQLKARLGKEEDLGGLCIRPLVFGENQLELYLVNNDDRVVLYGFRTLIKENEIEFFFRDGDDLSFSSGIDLARLDKQEQLENDQEGKQKRDLNGQPVQVTWIARNKAVDISNNGSTFDGTIAGDSRSLSPANSYQFEFYLYLKPCEIEDGCYVGTFTIVFMPGIGITSVVIRGDNADLGGQYHHLYQMLVSPDRGFSLSKGKNELTYFACSGEDNGRLFSESVGSLRFWFNILPLIVVVLVGFTLKKKPPAQGKL